MNFLFRFSATILAGMSLIACSTSYVVDAQFPRPLIQPIPVAAEIVFTDEFSNYVYVEGNENRQGISVDIGQAQVVLFETMTNHMFIGSESANRTLTITPSVEDFQYAIPRETRAEIYEIWLKYRVQVTTDTGESIADWLITGYGKTPTAFMKSQQDAIDLATTIALRDVGSQLTIGFSRQPDIQNWLTQTEG